MARVVNAEVREIITTDLDTTPFITAANLIVTDRLASSGFSAAYLKEIERWLAAHLVAIADERPVTEKFNRSEVSYADNHGLGLDVTKYGQQVKVLDTSGTLASLGQKRAGFVVISEAD